MTEPLTFLHAVWRLQPDGHFFCAYFDDTHTFRERSFPRVTNKSGWTSYSRKPRLAAIGNGIDLYFCPNSFATPLRRKSAAQKSRWLYADLDEVDPLSLELRPTLAWQTSPGRYQALWLLDKPLEPVEHGLVNQWLTYDTGADKGGWSVTKVLRVPGSISHKRDEPNRVKLLWAEKHSYSSATLLKRAQAVIWPQDGVRDNFELSSATALRKKYAKAIPTEARVLLRTKLNQATGDRSAILWKLENLLLEAGLNPGEVFMLVKASAWNKYRGQQREEAQLWAEISRAATSGALDKPLSAPAQRRLEASTKPKPPWNELPVPLWDFMAMNHPEPEWLITGYWVKGSYGLIVGSWKGFKSTALLDMALSVTSGKKFLGQFDVTETGTVLYIHEEGTPGHVKSLLHRIMMRRGLGNHYTTRNGKEQIHFGPKLPLYIWSFPGLTLSDPKHQARLEHVISQAKPKLVILETMYLLIGEANEDKATEMQPILSYLAKLSRDHNCALIVSHHYNKSSDNNQRSSLRISGSSVLSRWFESAIFCERVGEEEDATIHFHAEHRAKPGMPKSTLQFLLKDPDETTPDEDFYQVKVVNADMQLDPDTLIADFTKEAKHPTRRKRKTAAGSAQAASIHKPVAHHPSSPRPRSPYLPQDFVNDYKRLGRGSSVEDFDVSLEAVENAIAWYNRTHTTQIYIENGRVYDRVQMGSNKRPNSHLNPDTDFINAVRDHGPGAPISKLAEALNWRESTIRNKVRSYNRLHGTSLRISKGQIYES